MDSSIKWVRKSDLSWIAGIGDEGFSSATIRRRDGVRRGYELRINGEWVANAGTIKELKQHLENKLAALD